MCIEQLPTETSTQQIQWCIHCNQVSSHFKVQGMSIETALCGGNLLYHTSSFLECRLLEIYALTTRVKIFGMCTSKNPCVWLGTPSKLFLIVNFLCACGIIKLYIFQVLPNCKLPLVISSCALLCVVVLCVFHSPGMNYCGSTRRVHHFSFLTSGRISLTQFLKWNGEIS